MSVPNLPSDQVPSIFWRFNEVLRDGISDKDNVARLAFDCGDPVLAFLVPVRVGMEILIGRDAGTRNGGRCLLRLAEGRKSRKG
jgi:hypothetical protein